MKWHPGAEGCPQRCSGRGQWGQCSGLSYCSDVFALLFVSADIAPNYCLNGSFLTLNNHSTASPNAQDGLHTFLNHCAALVSPTLHPTAGQEQVLPFPNPPQLALCLHQSEEAETHWGRRSVVLALKHLKQLGGPPSTPTDSRAGYGFRRGLCSLCNVF